MVGILDYKGKDYYLEELLNTYSVEELKEIILEYTLGIKDNSELLDELLDLGYNKLYGAVLSEMYKECFYILSDFSVIEDILVKLANQDDSKRNLFLENHLRYDLYKITDTLYIISERELMWLQEYIDIDEDLLDDLRENNILYDDEVLREIIKDIRNYILFKTDSITLIFEEKID